MLRRYIFGIALMALAFSACKTGKQANNFNYEEPIYEMEELIVRDNGDLFENDYDPNVAPVYNGSATRIMDLEHTTLYISFNWQERTANGRAQLRLKPYFRPVDSFYLDANTMLVHSVVLKERTTEKPINFSYDGAKLLIRLPRTYKRNEALELIINYTAQPELIESRNGSAITDNKGLYFINPLGKENKKARQIWTQGETQSTSAWVPTIDAPNEKMTHDFFITVDDSLRTISNGEFISSSKEANGQRTDHWKMEKPHAPYLLALVVGQFHLVEDEWNDIPLGYYVDPRYTNSAKKLFENTPEMLSLFSNKLNYPYPWPKYDQVVVDDFISGAMENTTVSIFGSMLHLDTRELLERDYEDVIAHELFHHWFGDLVTCEAWGQLPLNESFATYSEYLWRDHKYGRDYADEHRGDWLLEYLNEASNKRVKMIRENFEHPDDMFDAHSYQKGGLILHMLRNYIGDSAFFEGLNLYLKRFAYGTAEIHNLRQCFEEVCGEDLNWFFNQWFFKSGHPSLRIAHNYELEMPNLYTLSVEQNQEGVYRLPTEITFYFEDSSYTEKIDITTSLTNRMWMMERTPLYVSFDARNTLLAEINELKTAEEWLATLKYSKRSLERLAALKHLDDECDNLNIIQEAIAYALSDPYHSVRVRGMELMKRLPPDEIEAFAPRIIDQAENHPKPAVRAAAFRVLTANPVSGLKKTIEKGLSDSAYSVNTAALMLLKEVDPKLALYKAEQFAKHPNDQMRYTSLFMLAGTKHNYMDLFRQAWELEDGDKFYIVAIISKYLSTIEDPEIIITLLDLINSFEPVSDEDFYTVVYITQCNQQIEARWEEKLKRFEAGPLKQNASPENIAIQKEMKRVLASVIHLY